jgi:hypothetical protein
MKRTQILPGTGRWQPERLTEGARVLAQRVELDGFARPVLRHLDESVAVQQQVSGQRFQQ